MVTVGGQDPEPIASMVATLAIIVRPVWRAIVNSLFTFHPRRRDGCARQSAWLHLPHAL